jgi:hypothetical protein
VTIPSTPAWWNAKYNDLPLLRVDSYQYPKHDGDMALLSELADRVLCYPASHVRELEFRSIYHRTCDALGIYPMQLIRAMRRECGDE